MNIATIDIGTNAVKLLIADIDDLDIKPIVQKATVTRLGQNVDKNRTLCVDAVRRTLDCLHNYRLLAQQHEVSLIEAVTTSAARDAAGVSEFLESARLILGVKPVITSGVEEAELSFTGALAGLSIDNTVALFDIGGGSTEIIVGRLNKRCPPHIISSTSLDIGCVRLTERHINTDPPSATNIETLDNDIDINLATLSPELIKLLGVSMAPPASLLRSTRDPALETVAIQKTTQSSASNTSQSSYALDPTVGSGEATVSSMSNDCVTWIGVGGTITSLVAIRDAMGSFDPRMIHGSTLTMADVDNVVSRLMGMSLSDRVSVVGLDPKRADVIVAGGCIVRRLLSWARCGSALVSSRGVQWGLAVRRAFATSASATCASSC